MKLKAEQRQASIPKVTKAHCKLRGASMLSEHTWAEITLALSLTRREVQIVQSIFDNLSETGIAQHLHISKHTVHTHLNRLFKKVTVTTRTELVLRIIEQLIALTLSETGVLPPSAATITPVIVACTTRPLPPRTDKSSTDTVFPPAPRSALG